MTSFVGKFGRRHDRECLCNACNSTYVTHQAGRAGLCDCRDCSLHRAFALIRNTAIGRELELEIEQIRANRKRHERGGRFVRESFRGDHTRDLMNDMKRIREEKAVATVNFCEKCTTMGKSDVMGTVVVVPVHGDAPGSVYTDAVNTSDRTIRRLEVCPGCVAELMLWFDAEPVGERPKAYTEPWKPAPKNPDGLPTDSATLMRLAIEASEREAGLRE